MSNRKSFIVAGIVVAFLAAAVMTWQFGLVERLAGIGRTDHKEHDGHDEHKEHEEHDDHDEHNGHEEHDEHDKAGHSEHEEHEGECESSKGHEEDGDSHAGEGDSHEDDGDSHEGEGGSYERGAVVNLSAAKQREFGVKLAKAGPGMLSETVKVPGEVVINADRVAHVVPRVSGIVREVKKGLGDAVAAGEVMAILDSGELAQAQTDYLAARERLTLAKTNLDREKKLWKQKVSAEREYIDAKQSHAEAQIQLNSAEQHLYILGVTHKYLKELTSAPDQTFEPYRLTAPIKGTVIEKHITLGEKLSNETPVFTVADLSTVWVDLNIYQKDLPHVRKGQTVHIAFGKETPPVEGKIAFVSPTVDRETRTAKARIILANPKGIHRPGLFVTADIDVSSTSVPVLVPKSAVQWIEDRNVVFVPTEKGLAAQPVQVGQSSRTHVEIVKGLHAGQKYVAKGAFQLKAQIITSGLDAHAGHGH